MVRALWEYGLYEQTDGAECMDTPLREHIPKERCFLSDKVQQGGGAARIIWHQLFPELGEGEGGKVNTAKAPAVLKMQQKLIYKHKTSWLELDLLRKPCKI